MVHSANRSTQSVAAAPRLGGRIGPDACDASAHPARRHLRTGRSGPHSLHHECRHSNSSKHLGYANHLSHRYPIAAGRSRTCSGAIAIIARRFKGTLPLARTTRVGIGTIGYTLAHRALSCHNRLHGHPPAIQLVAGAADHRPSLARPTKWSSLRFPEPMLRTPWSRSAKRARLCENIQSHAGRPSPAIAAAARDLCHPTR